jgi:1-acyl-sn-glycerol-3-phosphate acyltransferase
MRTTLPTSPNFNRFAALQDGPTAAQRKRVQKRAGETVQQWKDAFSEVVSQAQSSGRPRLVRPLPLSEMPNTLLFLSALATGQHQSIDPQKLSEALQPELKLLSTDPEDASLDGQRGCPAATAWIKRAVTDLAEGRVPSSQTVKTIRRGLVSYADNYAARIAVSFYEQAKLADRPFTAGEVDELTNAFAHTVELRRALHVGGGDDALAKAARRLGDPDVLGQLFQPSPHQPKLIHGADNDWIDKFRPITDRLAGYHQFEVHGMENIPTAGPAIIAMNHSVQTYEMGLFNREIHRQRSRDMRMLGDHMLFTIPGVSWVASQFGAIDGRPDLAKNALENGELLGVCPGGQREQLCTEKGKLLWDRALGYARLSVQTGAPVLLAATPRADEVFDQPGWFNKWVTQPIYKYAKLPVALTTGRFGLPWISCPPLPPNPKPVKLDTHVSRQHHPPVVRQGLEKGDPILEDATRKFAKQLFEEMKVMMGAEAADQTAPA